MSDILNKTIVLVLNRNWQAINIRTPADAFVSPGSGGEVRAWLRRDFPVAYRAAVEINKH